MARQNWFPSLVVLLQILSGMWPLCSYSIHIGYLAVCLLGQLVRKTVQKCLLQPTEQMAPVTGFNLSSQSAANCCRFRRFLRDFWDGYPPFPAWKREREREREREKERNGNLIGVYEREWTMIYPLLDGARWMGRNMAMIFMVCVFLLYLIHVIIC